MGEPVINILPTFDVRHLRSLVVRPCMKLNFHCRLGKASCCTVTLGAVGSESR